MRTASDRTILVVDDDADLRETLAQILADVGYSVASASNGEEALSYLRSGPPPSLILLDLMMPVMDGWQFRELQRNDAALAGIPVLVISASGTWQEQRTRLGVECVRKPVDFDHLLAAVERNAR
jgi:CheY-like chemotaxis protein